jgi:hypothetical protein
MDEQLWNKVSAKRNLMVLMNKGEEERCRKKIENLRRVVAEEEGGLGYALGEASAGRTASAQEVNEPQRPVVTAAPSTTPSNVAPQTARERLLALNEMLESDLITQEEYTRKRMSILASI